MTSHTLEQEIGEQSDSGGNIISGRRLLASERVLREGINLIPKWQSLRDSACREDIISRKESKRMMTA